MPHFAILERSCACFYPAFNELKRTKSYACSTHYVAVIGGNIMKNIKLLLWLPFVGMLLFLPLANRVEPYILGLPFLLFWIVAWMVLSSIILTVIYRFDPDNKGDDAE